MKFFRINKWEKFQHYKNPRPAWIKLYTSINDYGTDWRDLTDAQLGQLARLLAYAANNDNAIPHNTELLQDVLECDTPINLDVFESMGIITVFDNRQLCLSREMSRKKSREKSRQNPSVPKIEIEREREEEIEIEREKDIYNNNNKNKDRYNNKNTVGVDEKKQMRADALAVLDFLNQTTGRRFGRSEDILKCLKREKCSVEDCKTVIRHKWQEWSGTEMEKHVNPTTPFRPKHFQAYLDEARAGAPKKGQKTAPVGEGYRGVEEMIERQLDEHFGQS